jgi:preprotein translocase subunit SecG
VIESVLWIVFTLICIVLSGIILLQEGKGGGLGEAFGGAGQQTFGVKAQGIAKFTGWMAVSLVVLALVISKIRSSESVVAGFATAPPPPIDAPATPVDQAPATPPATPAGESDGN